MSTSAAHPSPALRRSSPGAGRVVALIAGGLLALLAAALISLMTFRTSQLPFVASYAPAPDLNTVGPVVLIGGLLAVSILSRVERYALGDIESAALFWSVLTAAVLPQLVVGRNTELDLPSAFDVPPPGTTRLDLG